MNFHYSFNIARKIAVVIAAVLALTGSAGSALAAAAPNQITVHNQDINSGIVVIDSVTTAQDGWIVLYKDTSFSPGAIVGYAPVKAGLNTNVKVTLDARRVGGVSTLWAQLHVDHAVVGLFEWGLRNLPYNDQPVVQNGQPVIAAFATTADAGQSPGVPVAAPMVSQLSAPALAPATVAESTASTDPIVVKNQDVNTGIVVIDSITAAQDGWAVVYDNPDMSPSDEYPDVSSDEVVGYAPVKAGVNTHVKVKVDTRRIANKPTLWVVLHVDNPVLGLFEWGLRNLPYNDPPAMVNGQIVIAAFGTTADQ